MSIGMARLMVGDEDEKLRAAFRAYDTDESGNNRYQCYAILSYPPFYCSIQYSIAI